MSRKQTEPAEGSDYWVDVRTRIQALIDADERPLNTIAKEVGVDGSALGKFMRGTLSTLKADAITLLAAEFDTTADFILTGQAAATGTANRSVIDIPLDRIRRWDGNPRKNFNPEAIEELAASIAEEAAKHGGSGILQNLVVREADDADGGYQIAAGESRWRALRSLVEAGRAPADVLVPCLNKGDLSDYQMLKIAMTENTRRRDMNPMEEARGYQRMLDLARSEGREDVTTATIAEDVGVTQRAIQLRLQLVNDLHPTVQEALEKHEIKLAHARALTMAPKEFQENAVDLITKESHGWQTQHEIKNRIKQSLTDPEIALFDLSRYKGPRKADPDTGKEYLVDRAEFEKLQIEAVRILAQDLEENWVLAVIVDRRKDEWFHSFNYESTQDKKKGNAYIEIFSDLSVKVHEGYLPKKKADADKKDAADKPSTPETTKGHLMHARRRKSQALQKQVMDNLSLSKRLLCLALSGGDEAVLIKREPKLADDAALHPDLEAALGERAKSLAKCHKGVKVSDRKGLEREGWGNEFDAPAWDVIQGMSEEAVDAFLCELTAAAVGSLTGYQAEPGDKTMPRLLAENLEIAGNEAEHGLALQPEDLKGLNIEALKLVAQGVGVDDAGTAKAIRARIQDRCGIGEQTDIDPVTDYVLPTLRFARPFMVEIANPEAYRHPSTLQQAEAAE